LTVERDRLTSTEGDDVTRFRGDLRPAVPNQDHRGQRTIRNDHLGAGSQLILQQIKVVSTAGPREWIAGKHRRRILSHCRRGADKRKLVIDRLRGPESNPSLCHAGINEHGLTRRQAKLHTRRADLDEQNTHSHYEKAKVASYRGGVGRGRSSACGDIPAEIAFRYCDNSLGNDLRCSRGGRWFIRNLKKRHSDRGGQECNSNRNGGAGAARSKTREPPAGTTWNTTRPGA
jgi:hypothetical protein